MASLMSRFVPRWSGVEALRPSSALFALRILGVHRWHDLCLRGTRMSGRVTLNQISYLR